MAVTVLAETPSTHIMKIEFKIPICKSKTPLATLYVKNSKTSVSNFIFTKLLF